MSETNVYVGNLSWNTTEEELRVFFAAHGALKSVRIVKDRETSRSRGFGFIEFVNEDDAHKALVEDGQPLGGRPLRVSLAARQQNGNGGGHRPGNGEKRGPRRSSRPRTTYGDEG